ncbi:ABC transporter permease [Rhodococcus sp. 06-412-2C]|uniref:ABC transporter permease n=1 Tax=unclassified Rhodococcus (in: high G+C Gram-positive bacteria) TaxID=192944 RepID=UPI000B9AE347|nr:MULTISPECIES: ABC transporter permease [unclassified Rhodococcus (in: high G+C Gram-positive bacteria)]OZC84653.1 ABC transporter permease [Rhodococcus sp. 06-412-2C]OZC98306.1 ABC transporter permease [Rhodococcus sp. 06-412-2B]
MTLLNSLTRRSYGSRKETLVALAIFAACYGAVLFVNPYERNAYAFNNYVVLLTPLALAAAGTTLVLLVGGFDLSVAGTVSLSNVVAATTMATNPDLLWLVIIGVVVLGLAVGLINGLLIVRLGLQSLAVTLGAFIVLTGIALIVLPAPGGEVPESYALALTDPLGPVPVALIVLVLLAASWWWYSTSTAGISAFAIGADRQAARMSGIRVDAVEILSYTLAGGLYSAGGLYLTAITASGDPNSGRPFLLTCFAAMALGLVGFRGGSGSVVAAVFGAASLIALPKLLFAAGVEDFWSGAVQGAVILIALALPLAATYYTKVRTARMRLAEGTIR